MYHYFHDDLQLAWRTCGIAGKVAMEMGLHRQDAIVHMIKDEAERSEVVNILWNMVVLDKQWSCAAGLPHHFSDDGFPRTLPKGVEVKKTSAECGNCNSLLIKRFLLIEPVFESHDIVCIILYPILGFLRLHAHSRCV